MHKDPKEKPAHIRDAEHQIAVALANLWVWSGVVDCGKLPSETKLLVYPHELKLNGPIAMKNSKRVAITLQIEDIPAYEPKPTPKQKRVKK